MRNLFCPLMVLSMALGVVPRLESLPAPAPAATQAELAQLLKSPEERVRMEAAEKLGKGGRGERRRDSGRRGQRPQPQGPPQSRHRAGPHPLPFHPHPADSGDGGFGG